MFSFVAVTACKLIFVCVTRLFAVCCFICLCVGCAVVVFCACGVTVCVFVGFCGVCVCVCVCLREVCICVGTYLEFVGFGVFFCVFYMFEVCFLYCTWHLILPVCMCCICLM